MHIPFIGKEKMHNNPRVSPAARELLRWLVANPPKRYTSMEIGQTLGMHHSEVSDAGHELRRYGATLAKDGDEDLQLAYILVSPAAVAAYNGETSNDRPD